MIKKIFSAFAMFTIIFLPANILAKNKPRVKFYNFDDMLIDGTVKKPKGLLLESRKSAKFNRLNRLEKSFLDKLEDTAKEKIFK